MFSIGEQPNPWIRPIWEAPFESLSQLTQASEDFWRGVQSTTPRLMLLPEWLIHKLASRLISDVLVGHAIQLALDPGGGRHATRRQRCHAKDSR